VGQAMKILIMKIKSLRKSQKKLLLIKLFNYSGELEGNGPSSIKSPVKLYLSG